MFNNYLKIAIRLLTRNKLISAINVFGLALSLTGTLLIAMFVQDELSYDRYHEQADRIYRVTRNFLSPDGSESLHLGLIAPPLGPLLKNDFPDILETARVARMYHSITLEENPRFKSKVVMENLFYADPSILKIFSIPLVAGESKTALERPNTLLISDAAAMKYFGTSNVVGKQLMVDQFAMEIVGVYKAFPSQSHWHPDILVSFSTLNNDAIYGRAKLEKDWASNMFSTYVLASDQFDAEKIEKQFPVFIDKYLVDSDLPPASTWTGLFLQPLTSIHLHSNLDFEIEANGNINHVQTMSAIGIFLVLIACFNFINLSTARATTRGKEVGLRKVVGAFRTQLVAQHIGESILIALLSFFVAIVFISLAIPWLNDFTNKSIDLANYLNAGVVSVVLGSMVFVGILAGLYPAFILSSFKPVSVLKGQKDSSKHGGSIRKALVVAQFSISITLITATLITHEQLKFMNDRELGYAKDQVITLGASEVLNHYEAFYRELTKHPAVLDAARSSLVPTDRLLAYQGTSIEEGDSLIATDIAMKDVRIDDRFFDTYGIPLLSGRNFSPEIKTDDSLSFIINETAARMVGWSNSDAIGKVLRNGETKGTVIGVVKDFHFESLHEPIVPVVFHGEHMFYSVSVKVSEQALPEALKHIEKVWKQFVPDRSFEYEFLSQRYSQLYSAEQHQTELFLIFAVLAIFIASLGLFGLATFNMLQRIKEVSIRKVLGASVRSIVQLLGKEILVLILLANLVALPVAWYFMREWLNGFAYHIEMNALPYILSGMSALVITLITVGSQTLKAAFTNPATILRNE